MANYSAMSDADFDEILERIVEDMSASELLAIEDVNIALREELNNAVLSTWAEENPSLAYPEDNWDD